MGGFCLPSVLLILFTIGMSSAHSCEPQMLCPSGWESWGGSCYKLLEGTMTWQDGRFKCQEMGGEMVAPSSLEENNYILSKTLDYVWINCNDIKVEGQWDCTPDNGGYRNWNPLHRPHGGTSRNCAELIPSWGGKWSDYPCSKSDDHVICKGKEVVATQAKLKQWRLFASCLTGHTLREIPTSNVRACATECDYDPICRSFNVQHFRSGERICQLNKITRYEADHTQFVKSKKPFTCIYGEK
ncbi:perlucin-like protein [Asterias amurensis]|uniref:perlucin-like protein n=1 Tax=Asterias amurensis TaxID=7602 RepID=UPI003AB2CE46